MSPKQGSMTHEERAVLIVEQWARTFGATAVGGTGVFETLIQSISRGMAEASNAELERRRAVEQERDHLRYVVGHLGDYRYSTWLREFFAEKAIWSAKTFGPGARTAGLVEHIRRELAEIEAEPMDLVEWVDVVLLAMDGYWRAFIAKHIDTPEQWQAFDGHDANYAATGFVEQLIAKQRINEARQWPAPGPQDQPTEHIKEAE